MIYKTVKKKKIKFRTGAILILILILYIIGFTVYSLLNKPITNIYIKGNNFYSDWDIITKAGLEDYPSALLHGDSIIENALEEDILIKKAHVTRKYITRVYIDIEENRPLFFSSVTNKTVLADKRESNDKYDTPVLLNALEGSIYDSFVENMNNIPDDVFRKISEIKYDPDEVDKERLLFTMSDGNYVYITMLKFDLINDYNKYVKKFNNKKGILYLNSGGYFKILED